MNLKIKQYLETETETINKIDWGDVIDMFGIQTVLEYFVDMNDNDDAIFECVDYLAEDVEEV